MSSKQLEMEFKKELKSQLEGRRIQILTRKAVQVPRFQEAPPLTRTDVRTKAALSSKKELVQVEVQAMQKDRVALRPAKQDVYRLTAVFLGTAYFARGTSNPVPAVTLVGQVLCQL